MDRLHVLVIHTTCDNRNTADGQHHQRDHAQGGAGHRGEGAPHP
uniref:Uncharacterized protein n=1 Tax=Arundo donax TaxID=35708 RepID=A0A0A9DZ22_ARUDO